MSAAPPLDRLSAALLAIVNALLGRKAVKTIDACALYWGVIAKQSGNLVEVMLDSKEIASPAGTVVPLYLGFPGSSVACAGARALVGFRNGDPTQPYAIAFEFNSPYTAIAIGNDSPKEAARKGDAVNLGACYVTIAAGAVATVVINGTALPVAADPIPPDRGTISGGSATVSIGD